MNPVTPMSLHHWQGEAPFIRPQLFSPERFLQKPAMVRRRTPYLCCDVGGLNLKLINNPLEADFLEPLFVT